MSAHDHPARVPGCYRCELSRDEEMHALTEQVTEMREVLGGIYISFNNTHRIYGNTRVCWGGIGGNMMTAHCSWDCENPVHAEENDRLRDLLIKARYLWEDGQ